MLNFLTQQLNTNSYDAEFMVGRFFNDNAGNYHYYSQVGYQLSGKSYALAMIDIIGTPQALVGAFSIEKTYSVTIAFDPTKKSYLDAIKEFRENINLKVFNVDGRNVWMNSSELSQPSAPVSINGMKLTLISFSVFAKETDLAIGNVVQMAFLKDDLPYLSYSNLTGTAAYVSQSLTKWVLRNYNLLTDIVVDNVEDIPQEPTGYIYYVSGNGNYYTYIGHVAGTTFAGSMTGSNMWVDTLESAYEGLIIESITDSLIKGSRITSPSGTGTFKGRIMNATWGVTLSVLVKENSYYHLMFTDELDGNSIKKQYQFRKVEAGVEKIRTVSIFNISRTIRNGMEIIYTLSIIEVE